MNENDASLDKAGILRWKSNDHCVPMDCLDRVATKGYDRQKHRVALDADIDAFLAAYRAQPRKRSSEELSEIMREIGPDAIDIVTGQRIFA